MYRAFLTRRRLGLPLLLAATIGLALSPGVATQQEPTTAFAERVEVRVVSVDVFVTDGRGEWVGGLGRDDFEVLEDGEPVEITNFYVVSPVAGADTRVATTAREPADSAPIAAASDPELPEESRRSLVVFIDGAHLAPGRRQRLLDQVGELLDRRLAAGDRVVIASLDRGVRVHTSLASHPETVRSTLPELMRAVASGAGQGAERRILQTRMRRLNPGDEAHLVEIEQLRYDIGSYAESQAQEIERGLVQVGSFLDTIGGLPGRKALLYVSDGFSTVPGQDLFLEWSGRFGTPTDEPFLEPALRTAGERVRRALAEVTAHANRRRVTFYTLSSSVGGGGTSQVSAEHGSGALAGIEYVGARADFAEQTNRLASVERLAADTGGQAILNVNATTLAAIDRDLDRYYSLGFRPLAADNRDHRIEVRVKRPGLEVRHRPSYRSQPARVRAAELAASAHLLASPPNPLGASAELGQGRLEGDGLVLPVLVKVPVETLALLPRDGNREGRLTVLIVVHDERGRSSPMAEVPVPVRIPESSFPAASEQQVGYPVEVKVRPGEQMLTLTLYDELGGAVSVLRQSLRIAPDGRVSQAASPL